MARPRIRSLLLAGALLLCTALQSCFTTVLWESEMRDEKKLYFTPVSVALDVLTLPAQVAIFGCSGGHCGPHRCH